MTKGKEKQKEGNYLSPKCAPCSHSTTCNIKTWGNPPPKKLVLITELSTRCQQSETSELGGPDPQHGTETCTV